jgi:hypothetical protein
VQIRHVVVLGPFHLREQVELLSSMDEVRARLHSQLVFV